MPAMTPRSWVIQIIAMPSFCAQFFNQFEDLRLNGHVQRRRRFIGDQHFRVTCQGDGDHHPLAHSAGKLVRVVVQAARRIGNADKLQQFSRPFACRCLAQPQMFRSGSMIWKPTVNTGLRLVIGS